MYYKTNSDNSTVCRGLDKIKISHVDDDIDGFWTKNLVFHPSKFSDMSFTNVGGALRRGRLRAKTACLRL